MFMTYLGKYRNIVISIALFLILDLGVLILNFVISSEISSDAVNVNLAGRQRMLSQRTAKTALQVEERMANGRPTANELAELKAAASTFDRTLKAFAAGGQTLSGSGTEIAIARIDDEAVQAILAETATLWTPFFQSVRLLTETSSPGPELAADVARKAEVANLKLLKLMNDLTTRVEETASNKATNLRMVQITGITLATINFVIILVHFIGHLRQSDRDLERAQRETADILRTTQEGLFLLDLDFEIGHQHSKALVGILGIPELAGRNLLDLLRPVVSDKTLDTTREYLDLLVKHDVKEKLVTSLNPLNRVDLAQTRAPGQSDLKSLEFNFNRVMEDGKVTHLLATVNDITRRVKLERDLQATEERAKGQMSVLVEIMQIEPAALNPFLKSVAEGLQDMNRLLSTQDESQAAQKAKVNALFRHTHRIKGDAAGIGMTSLAELFHRVEDQLAGMRECPSLTGENFLPVTVKIKELFEHVGQIESAVERIGQIRGATAEAPRPQGEPAGAQPPFVAQWTGFADKVAQRHGNRVEVVYAGIDAEVLPEPVKAPIHSIVNQFIRNAVGIEPPGVRQRLGKAPAGRLAICISRRDDGGVDLSFRDDGRGLSVDAIRKAAVASGRLTEEEAGAWDERRIVGLIFEGGFSTAARTDEDAGRGAGLDAVKELVAGLGGQIRIRSAANEYCHFRISLAPGLLAA
jgi:HPt (histidine-containing phosphotransfer) domain-containing protein/PAS domain-containing protein